MPNATKITAKDFNIYNQTIDDREKKDFFGIHMAAYRNSLAVGAYGKHERTGAVYVYQQDMIQKEWKLDAKITASDGIEKDRFGWSVAISADMLVIGAYYANTQQGSVYIFLRNSVERWYQSQKLVASDGEAYDYFGQTVAIFENTILVGTRGAGLYFFGRKSTGFWEEFQTKEVGREGDDYFGGQIAVSEEFVATAGLIDNKVLVYIYSQSAEGRLELVHELSTIYSGLRGSIPRVSLSNDTIVVGTYLDSNDKDEETGAVHIFKKGDGSTWKYTQKLLASDGQTGDSFGWSIVLSGDTLIVGDRLFDTNGAHDAGAAYLFKHNKDKWVETKKVVPSDSGGGDKFGMKVLFFNDTLMVSAQGNDKRMGSVYVKEIDF